MGLPPLFFILWLRSLRLVLGAGLLRLTAAVSVTRRRRFLFPLRRIFFEDAVLNFLLVGIPDLTVALVGDGVRVFIVEFYAPFEEQLEVYPHRMHTRFHHDKVALGQGLEFVRCQRRSLYHLK